MLVLSGELDSITTAAEGAIVKRQFPNARQVLVANSFHVTGYGDTDDCAQRIVRVVRHARRAQPVPADLLRCARKVPPLRSPGVFPRTLDDVAPAQSDTPLPLALRRAGHAAALTVADLQDRWWNNYSEEGVGLRGGTWTYTGDPVHFRLHKVRLMRDQNVSGKVDLEPLPHRMTVDLTLRGTGPHGHLVGHWDTRARRRRGGADGKAGRGGREAELSRALAQRAAAAVEMCQRRRRS